MSCWIFCNARYWRVAQRHRDVAERVLEIVLASLDEPRKPKPGLTRIRRNLYRRGILSRS
ncbi:fructose repressor [Salmonella enterica subsp. enterica]|nr:fructose repressor [Salmonella enterica subsp. enterica]VUC90189.1 fructose repressor [Salmonella sp. NCTC 11881]